LGRTYRVVDCKPALGAPGEIMQLAGSPEEAARLALGLSLHRGGHIRDLRAKVYLDAGGTVSMYRLYTRSLHEPDGEHAP
jgi:hypothetical protein